MNIHNQLKISVDSEISPIQTESQKLCENLNSQFLNGKESTDFIVKKIFKVGDNQNTSFQIIHNLEYSDVIILIYNNNTHSLVSSGYQVEINDGNSFNLTFTSEAPQYLEYSCLLIK